MLPKKNDLNSYTPFTITLLIIIFLTSCSIVDISQQNPRKYLIDSRANIITSSHLSNNSMGMLRMAGMEYDACIKDFTTCIKTLDSRQFVEHTPRQLALYAELYYAKAKKIKKSRVCKKYPKDCQRRNNTLLLEAVRYSYAYLFIDNTNPKAKVTLTNLASPLDIQVKDIYDTASKHLIDELSPQILSVSDHILHNQGNISKKSSLTTNRIDIDDYQLNVIIPKNVICVQQSCNTNQILARLKNNTLPIDTLVAASTLKMTGLNSVSRRNGIGLSYVAQKSNRYRLFKANPTNSHIHDTGNLLLTAIMRPHGNDLKSILNSRSFSLQTYDAYQQATVSILNKSYPLSANFSANYALWLNENSLQDMVGLVNMVRTNERVPLPHLYKLQPFDPNKRIIIMMHGLASSPITWVNLTNDLLNDQRLRDNYQVWQVFYSTHLPMLENRYHTQKLIEKAYQQNNADTNAKASKDSVIIAHSMGSLISRLMLSDDNLNKQFATLTTKIYPDSPTIPIQRIQRDRLNLHTLKPVDTAIFVASPFQGTNFADRWFMAKLREFIKLPTDLMKINKSNKQIHPLVNELFLINGADQLSDKSAFIKLTRDININKRLEYHSIIGKYDGVLNFVNRNSQQHKQSDGIVPYESAHLKGAKSETIIAGGHDIHTDAKTILQLRKILHDHLNRHEK